MVRKYGRHSVQNEGRVYMERRLRIWGIPRCSVDYRVDDAMGEVDVDLRCS